MVSGMGRGPRFLCGLVVAGVMACAQDARATTIKFEATNLVDIVSGEDLWTYKYFVSDTSFEADQGFMVFFDALLYSNLDSAPNSAGPDWDVLVVQPDLALEDEGRLDPLALVAGASLLKPFSVTFTWLGAAGTQPGSQPFLVYQDPFDINVLESGVTQPLRPSHTVPEPATLLLSGLGLALASRFRRRC
jgi:hypothetical protein